MLQSKQRKKGKGKGVFFGGDLNKNDIEVNMYILLEVKKEEVVVATTGSRSPAKLKIVRIEGILFKSIYEDKK